MFGAGSAFRVGDLLMIEGKGLGRWAPGLGIQGLGMGSSECDGSFRMPTLSTAGGCVSKSGYPGILGAFFLRIMQ